MQIVRQVLRAVLFSFACAASVSCLALASQLIIWHGAPEFTNVSLANACAPRNAVKFSTTAFIAVFVVSMPFGLAANTRFE